MQRRNRVLGVLFWAVFTPLLISSSGLVCERTSGDTRLASLELEVLGQSRLAFDPALRVYEVWLPAGATQATLGAVPMDPAARVTWYVPDGAGMLASGIIGVGGGEVTVDLPPDGYSLYIGVFPPGGARNTYIVNMNPACPVGQPCSNGGGPLGVCQDDTCVDDTEVARIEITPSSPTLTEPGDTVQLRAQGYNSIGQEIHADVTWTSVHSEQVSVGPSGLVIAEVAIGSSTIVATSGTVDSAPAIVAVVRPVEGAIMVSDDQVVEAPTLVGTDDFDLGTQFALAITSSEPLAVGDILLPRESLPVGGRIVSVQNDGSDFYEIVIEIVTLPEMYADYHISETVDLSQLELTIPDEIRDIYDVERGPNGEFILNLREDATAQKSAEKEFFNGRIVCKYPSGADNLPFRFEALPVNVTLNPDLDIMAMELSGDPDLDQEVIIRASLDASLVWKPRATAAIGGEITCVFNILRPPDIPVLGPFAIETPIGIGSELKVTSTLGGYGWDIGFSVSATAEFGFRCVGDTPCALVANGTATGDALFDFVVQDASQLTLEVNRVMPMFPYMDLDVGLKKIPGLPDRFNPKLGLLRIYAGPHGKASIATVDSQISRTDYESNYSISWALRARAKQSVEAAARLARVRLLNLQFEVLFGTEPSPTLSEATANVETFDPGDTVEFTLKLDPENVEIFDDYVVDRVSIWRRGEGGIAEQLVTAEPAPDQTEFTLEWEPVSAGAIANDFFAFYSTEYFFDELQFELGPVRSDCTRDLTDPAGPFADPSDVVGRTFWDPKYCEYLGADGTYTAWYSGLDATYSGSWNPNGDLICYDGPADCYTVAVACDRAQWFDTGGALLGPEGTYEDGDTCQPTEFCDNGDDDDDDGDTDCNDTDCNGSPLCEDCTNGVDDDDDFDVDCDDQNCIDWPGCEEDCTNGVDDNNTGTTDCYDWRCVGGPDCVEDCGNGIDDDGDNKVDCADPDCVGLPACIEDCSNGLDDDADFNVDCRDSDCTFIDPACGELCTNGVDDDNDGYVDCADGDCIGFAGCNGGDSCGPNPRNIEFLVGEGNTEVEYARITTFTFGNPITQSTAGNIPPRQNWAYTQDSISGRWQASWEAKLFDCDNGFAWIGRHRLETPEVCPDIRKEPWLDSGGGFVLPSDYQFEVKFAHDTSNRAYFYLLAREASEWTMVTCARSPAYVAPEPTGSTPLPDYFDCDTSPSGYTYAGTLTAGVEYIIKIQSGRTNDVDPLLDEPYCSEDTINTFLEYSLTFSPDGYMDPGP